MDDNNPDIKPAEQPVPDSASSESWSAYPTNESPATGMEQTQPEMPNPIETPQPTSATDWQSPAEQNPNATIPTKWNWGGLALTFPMAIANRAYLGLLVLLTAVPFIGWIFGIVWIIISGINIEKWSLENPKNHYRDEEEFRKVMDGWNRAGLITFIIGAGVLVLWLVVAVFIVSMANLYGGFY